MDFKLKFEPTNTTQIDEIEYIDYQSMKDHLKYLPNNMIATHKLNTTTYLNSGSHGRIYNTKLTNTCTGDVKDGIIKISFDSDINLFKQETLIQALISQYSAKDTIFILPCVIKYKSVEIEDKNPGSRFAVTNTHTNVLANIQEKGLVDLSTAYHRILEHMGLNVGDKTRNQLLFSYTKSIEYVFKKVLKAFNDVQILFNSQRYIISHADCHFGNILVDNTYNAKLMDFGYVKLTPISDVPQTMIYKKKGNIFPNVDNAEYTIIYNSFKKNLLGITDEEKISPEAKIIMSDDDILYEYAFEEKDLVQKFDGDNFLLTGEDYSMLLYFYSLLYMNLIEYYLSYAKPEILPSVPYRKVKFKNIGDLSHLVHETNILGENLMNDTYKVSDEIETPLTDVEKKDIDELARHVVTYLKNIFIHMPLVKVMAKFHVRSDLNTLVSDKRYIYIYKCMLQFVNYLFGGKLYVAYCQKILRSSETNDVKEKQMSDAIIHIMIRFLLFSALSAFDNSNILHIIGIVPIRHISHYINLLI